MFQSLTRALAMTEIMPSVRHEMVSVLERCGHWIMFLRQPDDVREVSTAEAIEGLETDLGLLENALRRLDAALIHPVGQLRDG